MGKDVDYVGALDQIRPEQLDEYEATGEWVAQPKLDGMWVKMIVGPPNVIISRNSKGRGEGSTNGLEQLIVKPRGLVPIGELLAQTEWATAQYEKLGYRQIYLFDLSKDEKKRNLYELFTWWERYNLLMDYRGGWSEDARKRLMLVEAWQHSFRDLFDREVAEGREGVMLWRKSQKRTPGKKGRADGKVQDLIKCKKLLSVSFVLLGTALTTIGQKLTGRWGLFKKGKLVDVMQAGAADLRAHADEWIGRVADFEGFEQFRSGALRSAQFKNWRDDVDKEECVLPEKKYVS